MIFRKKRLSDNEYVELIRKRDRVFRKWRWVWFVLMIAAFVTMFFFNHMVQRISSEPGIDRDKYDAGMFLGITFGFFWVLICVNATVTLWNWIQAKSGFRTERLLLEYYDKVEAMNACGRDL